MKESTKYQLEEWIKGNPIHNNDRDECTPDFSCCRGKEFMAPELTRKRFAQACYEGDEELKMEMLMNFLADSLNDVGKKAHIAGSNLRDSLVN